MLRAVRRLSACVWAIWALSVTLGLSAPAGAIEFTTDTTITTAQYVGEPIIVTGCTLTIDCSSGKGNYASLTIQSGTVTHPAGSANGLWLDIAGNVYIDPWAQINVSGRGYPADNGPGVGSAPGAGGTYGGTGQASTTPVYGDFRGPTQLGSGGASRPGFVGGAGGGLIRITAGGQIDNVGWIRASGADVWDAGAGSGGGVYLKCSSYTGTGHTAADGGFVHVGSLPGDAVGGGGGGGRVAVEASSISSTGQIWCRGGWGSNKGVGLYGGPGTRYWKVLGTPTADLNFWNEDRPGWTCQPAIDASDVNLTVQNGWVEFNCEAQSLSVNTLSIYSAAIAHPVGSEAGLSVVTVGNMLIDPWAAIDLNGRGYAADTGPGASAQPGIGGTHGGTGQGSTAPVNDSYAAPELLGSGGSSNGADMGGRGGGRAKLEVGGTLTNNGWIRARGDDALRAGGGSGGSVHVICDIYEGNGHILADGGNVDVSGLPSGVAATGGGGGRIALHYTTKTNSGVQWCRGGWGRLPSGDYYGGAGTRYWKTHGAPTADMDFWNDARPGWTMQPAIDDPMLNLTSANNGLIEFNCAARPVNVRSLTINSSTITHPVGSMAGLQIVTSGDLVVDPWASIDVDRRGYAADAGPGAGTVGGSGGAYGGNGQGSGAAVYGAFDAPQDLGSGGASNGADIGGRGGGRIGLQVGGTLTNNGWIRARGANALRAGAGSGGGVHIATTAYAGTGHILADGGDANTSELPPGQYACGGGGGRIAVQYSAWTNSGAQWARGGWGRFADGDYHGGAGTRYRHDTTTLAKSLDFWNDGRPGWTRQPAISDPDIDLGVYNNALLEVNCASGPLSVKSLVIGSSTMSHPAGSEAGLQIVTAGGLTIDPWASINVDGRGYASGSGPGAGAPAGAGGGYGGTGQGSTTPIYGSYSWPDQLGSGGAANGAKPGGSGGGRVQLQVAGALSNSGSIRARGSNGYAAGAGSGGSVSISCSVYEGNGHILADGGDVDTTGLGAGEIAGGGAGGRVALNYFSYTNSGVVWSRGGWGRVSDGDYHGGPGTRYWENLSTGAKTLSYWNDGRWGQNRLTAFSAPDVDVNFASNANAVFDCSGGPLIVQSLTAQSSQLTHQAGSAAGLQVVATGNINLDPWATINVSGLGFGAETGPGGGMNGQGGGHGGRGGYGAATYGARECPANLGSGGGGTAGGPGTAGGGRLVLQTGGKLTIDGQIYAGGANSAGGGAGSGGSVLLMAHDIAGSGGVYANGGNASQNGPLVGGGGGGRIAVYTDPGQAWSPGAGHHVDGGYGNEYGAVGTIYHGDQQAGVDLWISQDYKWTWNPDGSGTANISVMNLGGAGCGAFKVGLYDRDPSLLGAVLLDSVTVGGLGPYSVEPVTLNAAQPVSINTAWLKVDYENVIPETNETNNVRSFSVPRIGTVTGTTDRTGTITETVGLRGYLKRTSDNAWLDGKTIVFRIDGTTVGTAVTGALGTSGRADLNWTITAGPATRTITTAFNGDPDYGPSSGNAKLTAQSWTTKMVVFARTARITDRTELKARLLRSDNAPIYGKTIAFYIDGTFIINRLTNTDGYASHPNYDVPDGAGAGVRTIRADWAGNAGYSAISRETTLTVLKAIPYIWVLSKSVPQGGIANLYSYFRRLYDYKKMENKPVTFRIDGTWIADVNTGTVASGEPGVARYLHNTTGLGLGPHTVRCEFAGDAWLDAGFGEGNLNIL